MRVTQNSNFGVVNDTLHRSKSRMEDLQQKAATMRQLNTPADDPIAAAKVLEIRTDKVVNDQLFATAKMAESYMNNSDHALEEVSDIIMRAKEIAINQASGASSTSETRLGVAEEVAQLFMRAVSAANTKIGDRYLFSGFKDDKPAIDPEGRYVGDDGEKMVEIAKGVFLAMNIPGLDVFNTNPKLSADGRKLYGTEFDEKNSEQQNQAVRGPATAINSEDNVNVFDELQNLRISLLSGDLDGVRGTLDRFDRALGSVISTRAKLGARVTGLQSALSTTDRHNLTNSQLSSNLEDADMAKVMSDMAKEETVFNSVLGSSKKLILPTLMDFLK